MKAIITDYKAGKEGVLFHLNKRTRLKKGHVKGNSFWVSWDKIGELLFDDYTDDITVDGRNELRKSKED